MDATNKIIFITENKRLFHSISNVTKKYKLEIESELLPLCDLTFIKTQLKFNPSTKFIRTAFLDFYKKYNHLPFLILMDYRIDAGLSKEVDPDNKKILRAILVSTALITKSENFHNNEKVNIILIGSPKDIKDFEIYKSHPYFIFKTIKTSNLAIDSILEFYVNNPEKTKEIFYFDYLVINENQDVVTPTNDFERIVKNIIEKKEKLLIAEKTKDQTPIITEYYEPAKVMYKISDARLYVDGQIFDITGKEKFKELKEGIIYIVGHYVNSNYLEVNKKIEKFLREDLSKIRKFTPDEKIIISINSHTVIDGSTSTAINTLFGFKLSDFKNLVILTSEENHKKLENSPGFISLRKYLLKERI